MGRTIIPQGEHESNEQFRARLMKGVKTSNESSSNVALTIIIIFIFIILVTLFACTNTKSNQRPGYYNRELKDGDTILILNTK